MIDLSYIEKIRRRLTEVESDLANPSAVVNVNLLKKLTAEHTSLRSVLALADRYLLLLKERDECEIMANDAATDSEMRAVVTEDLQRLDKVIPEAEKKLKIALLPPCPEESRGIIMEIRAGTGGEESALFASDLFRMYSRYIENRGWKISLIDANPTNIGGYKEIVFAVEGTDVYRFLRYESGVHRVQRVPATEAQGRIHTSAATVAVLPEAEELDDIEIKPEDLKVDTYRSSGAGGQHVNKTESAIRITHLPSGLVVQSQEERSQHRNREKAMRALRALLLDAQKNAANAKTTDSRRSQVGSGDRSERIRTYNFPQNRLTDHRINFTLYNLDKIVEGDLDALINALYEYDIEKRIEKEMLK